MKITLLSLLGAVVAAQAAPAQKPDSTTPKLDESEVRISYAELKRLLAAAQPTPSAESKPKPPVPAALLSSLWRLDTKKGRIIAEMSTQSFVDGWQAIPLAGATLGAVEVQPPDTRLIIQDDHLCLLTDQIGPQTITLSFPLTFPLTLHLAPSPVAALEITELPAEHTLRMQSGSGTSLIRQAGRHALPAAGGSITLDYPSSHPTTPESGANDEAILTTATYITQVVRDGSVLTEGSLLVRHDPPMRIQLTLPKDARLLQCHVNDQLVRPTLQNGSQLEIPLDDPTTDGGESKIDISFTTSLPALQATEGEIELALPQTPLFAREIDWQVRLPSGFDLAATGNVEALPPAADAKPGLHLRKALCRDQQPQARITYRRQTTPTQR